MFHRLPAELFHYIIQLLRDNGIRFTLWCLPAKPLANPVAAAG